VHESTAKIVVNLLETRAELVKPSVAVAPYPFGLVAIAAVAGWYIGVKLVADSTENISITRPSPSSAFAAL